MHWKILLTSILAESCPLGLGSGFSHAMCIFKQQKPKSRHQPKSWFDLFKQSRALKWDQCILCRFENNRNNIRPACFKLTNEKPWFEAVNQLESSNMNQKPTFDSFNHWETHNIVRQESKSACGLCGFLSRLNEWRAMLPELCDEKSP